jgi:hypothetical protein
MILMARWWSKMRNARVSLFSAGAQLVSYGLLVALQCDSVMRARGIGGAYYWRSLTLGIIPVCLLAFGILQVWFTVRRVRAERKVV